MKEATEKIWLSPREVSKLCHRPLNTIYYWIYEGKLKARQLSGQGGRYQVHVDEARRFLAGGEDDRARAEQ